jgi:hypothetical protein
MNFYIGSSTEVRDGTQTRDGEVRTEGKSEDRVIKIQLRLTNTGPNSRESSAVCMAAQSDFLRELSNGSVHG